MIISNYDLHGFIKFKIIDNRSSIYRIMDVLYGQYTHYQVADIDECDFTVNIGFFQPKNNECSILDDKFYVKNNYFYCKDKRKFAKWKLEIEDIEGNNTCVRIDVNFWGNISVAVNIIDFLIHLKMTEKGHPLIHASAALIDNEVCVFAGRSGGGKTTVITYLMERGIKYFGDNFVIITKNKIFNFISPLNLFNYNLTPLVKRNLKINKKAELFFKDLLYILSGKNIKFLTKLDLSESNPDLIAEFGELRNIILLMPNKNFYAKKISKKELIDHLVYNQKIEFMHLPFLTYFSAYSYVFPVSKICTHWDIYRKKLEAAIDGNIATYEITVPLKMNNTIIEKMINLIG